MEKLENFRDETMGAKISLARAQIEGGVTKLERDTKAAYEAVKLKVGQIKDHQFQYNVRTLLEKAKDEADRRFVDEEDKAYEQIDVIEEWAEEWTESAVDSYYEKIVW